MFVFLNSLTYRGVLMNIVRFLHNFFVGTIYVVLCLSLHVVHHLQIILSAIPPLLIDVAIPLQLGCIPFLQQYQSQYDGPFLFKSTSTNTQVNQFSWPKKRLHCTWKICC